MIRYFFHDTFNNPNIFFYQKNKQTTKCTQVWISSSSVYKIHLENERNVGSHGKAVEYCAGQVETVYVLDYLATCLDLEAIVVSLR